MSASRSRPTRLSLEDLIDLELQLQADRERDSQELRQRDAEIGQTIDARRLADEGDDRALFLAWLRQLQSHGKPSRAANPGRQVKLFLEVVGLVLAVFGLSSGFGAVTGWLRMDPTEPVNAIFFWSVLVGLQLILLSMWLLAVVPASWLAWIPGAEAVQMLVRLLARALPLVVAWGATRLSSEHRLLLARIRGTLQSWGWVYGKLRFWKLIGLTQVFAVAYNVGTIFAFVGISYGNDPAFGWKSRLLSAETLHQFVRIIAAPWSGVWPAAAPTLEQIQLTRFSSLDPRYREIFESRAGEADAWVLWWPFLLACLIVYGLLPRVATLLFCQYQTHRALAKVRLDHGDFYKLKDRLTRPFVETRATAPEAVVDGERAHRPPRKVTATSPTHDPPAPEARQAAPSPSPAPTSLPTLSAPRDGAESLSPRGVPREREETIESSAGKETPIVSAEQETPGGPPPPIPAPARGARTVVKWAGVNANPKELADLVRDRLGVEPSAVHTVGDLQGQGDEATLAALQNDGRGEVLMIVESWEPPIADYLDFLSDLRDVVGRERMIVVLLYNRDAAGAPVSPRPRDARVWRDQIASLGDPWMCVESLVEDTEHVATGE